MKNAIAFLCLLLLLQGCKKNDTDPTQLTPVTPTSPGISQTDTLQVLGFSLPGIPKENISIDHAKREIQVTLPANVSATAFPASITVTAGYMANPGNSRFPYRFDLLTEKLPIEFYKQGDEYSVPIGTPYHVRTQVSGPLGITDTPSSLSFGTGEPLLISVSNYYDDAVNSNSAVITNQLTGQQYTASITSCTQDVAACKGVNAGTVLAYFDSNIPSGKYDLEIRKANKRQARATTPLTVTKGLPFVYDDYYNPPMPGAKNRKIEGVNLYEDDRIELLLKNQMGQQYTLKSAGYAADGKSMLVDIPADVKPSQYSVQLIRSGQLLPAYSRMVISRDRSQPAVVSINYGTINVAPDVPLVLVRGQKQGLTFVIAQDVENVRLKLTPVGTGQPPVSVDVNTPRAYFVAGPDGGLPSFVLPETMPTGKYMLVLQYIMTDKRIVEGEPFERLIEAR